MPLCQLTSFDIKRYEIWHDKLPYKGIILVDFRALACRDFLVNGEDISFWFLLVNSINDMIIILWNK